MALAAMESALQAYMSTDDTQQPFDVVVAQYAAVDADGGVCDVQWQVPMLADRKWLARLAVSHAMYKPCTVCKSIVLCSCC